MRTLLRYSLLASIAGGLLVAQGHGGGAHSDGVVHAPGPMDHGHFGGYRGAGLVGYNPSFHTGVPPQPTQPIRVNRIIGDRDHDFRGRGPSHRYGYGYVLPYYPNFGYDNFWNESSAYGPVDTSGEQTQEVTANLLGEQIQRLTAEVESLRSVPQSYAPQPYPQQQYPMQAVPPADDPPDPKPIVLVLHSGQTLQVRNYAIMNGVLWDFSQPNSKRIPLSTIDAPASEKATEAGGGSFPESSFATNPN